MKKKITIDRPKIDAKEIASRQDFNSILNQLPPVPTIPFYQSGWFYTTVAAIAGVAIITSYLISNAGNDNDEIVSMENPPVEISSTPQKDSSSTSLYKEDTKCFVPPNKEMDIKMISLTINGAKGGKLSPINGTEINIPAEAFTKLDGTPIAEDVQIQYREIRNPIDMMLSGIPMKYDSANLDQVLLSDGMIEIEGFLNGEKIKIAPNKSIEVALVSENSETKFNAYSLEKNNGKWNYEGKPEINTKEDPIENHFTYAPSSSDFSAMTSEFHEEMQKAQVEYESAKKDVSSYEKSAPEKPVSTGNKDRQFVLDVNPNEFPELASYENLVFEVEKSDMNFSSSVYQEEWTDVSLSDNQSGKTYLMTLFKKGSKKTFSVFPVFSGNDLNIAMTNFNKKFETYSKELTKRKEKEATLKTDFDLKLNKWKKAKEKEAAAIVESNLKKENSNKISTLSKILNVTTFGIWNVDCGIIPPTGIKNQISFKDQNGNPLDIVTINLFEKGKNTIYTYTKEEFDSFEFNPQEENVIIAFINSDKVGIADQNQFKGIKENEHKTFVLNIQKLTPELIEELKTKTI